MMHHKNDVARSGEPSEPDNTSPDFFKISSGDESYRVRELNTLDWVFNHPELLAFCKSKNDEFMCLQADPGCGKSVCTKSLLNEHVFDDGNGLVCACFITKYRPEGERAAMALQALLYQIYTARPALISIHASDKLKTAPSSALSDKELLWDMLFSTISDPTIGDQIVLLIDGVDECDDSSWLISKISKLWHRTEIQKDTKRPRLKVFYTAAKASLSFEKLRVISGQAHAEQIGLDLETLYKGYLKGSNSTSNHIPLSQAFEKFSQKNANYLAFELFRAEIEKEVIDKTKKERMNFLTTIPKTLDQVYQELFKRDHSDDLLRVLCIVLGAAEPLTLEELGVALAIRSDISLYEDIQHKQPRQIEQFLLSTCAPFFKVVNNKVYFVHHSLMDWLTCTRKYGRPAKFGEVRKKCHYVLSTACISFLNLKDIAPNRVSTGRSLPTSSSKKRKITDSATSGNSAFFFKYATQHWLKHFRQATRFAEKDPGILEQLCTPQKVGEIPLLLRLCRPHNPEIAELAVEIENLMPQNCLTEENKTVIVLYITAWLGLDVVLKHMLPTRWGQKIPPAPGTNPAQRYINRAPRKGYLTPLGVAATRRHETSVILLLMGETVPLENDMSPGLSLQLSVGLDWAFLFNHAMILVLKDGGNALSRIEKQYEEQLIAATSGNPEYVEGLLSKGFLPGERNLLIGAYSSALRAALDVDEPNINIVKKLIDYGAEVNYRGMNDETNLEVAAQHEEPQLVILLLRAGAYSNFHSNRGKRWYEYAGMENVAAEAGIDITID